VDRSLAAAAHRGEIHSTFPIPLSLLIAAALAFIAIGDVRQPLRLSAFVIAALIFPLAQISLFGFTDYRRPADVIVVFGASGAPLYDRVRTACKLYRAGLAPKLLFSGGPGEPRRAASDAQLRDASRRREDAAFWTYYLRRFKTNPQSAAR